MAIIQRLDGTTYDLKELGIRTKDIIISFAPPRHNTGSIEGRDGDVDYGTTYGPRPITGLFKAVARDVADFPLLRDEVFHLFRTKEPFYLIEKRRRGKRWLVKRDNTPDISQKLVYGDFSVGFVANDGYAESIGTTKDIQDNGLSADDELWAYGMGLIADDNSLIYRHTVSNGEQFGIYNAGNVAVHPFEQDIIITIDNVTEAGNELSLKNETNDTEFVVEEAVASSQVIVLDGPNITSNGLAFLRKTNKQFIQLEPGWNYFKMTGASSARVDFNFRFYYE